MPFPPNPSVGWVGVVWVLTALGCAIYLIVETKGTKYVMTKKRIMVTRLEKVVKEISLSSFMGKPVSQFVDSCCDGE